MDGENFPEGAALTGNEQERLAAARALRNRPRAEALKDLKSALARERVRWIRTALEEAIASCEGVDVQQPDAASLADREASADNLQAYADGRRDGLRQALHELAPIVGLARAAADDLDADSELRGHLAHLRAVTAALRQLANASAVPELREFDLVELLVEISTTPPVACPAGMIGVRDQGAFMVRGDPDLIELAVRPLLANAIEAVIAVHSEPSPGSVAVSCGAEEAHYWIAVNDNGPGLPAKRDLFAIGGSDKEGHSGFGLETAQTAIRSLDGSLEVSDRRDGGATALLRWPGGV